MKTTFLFAMLGMSAFSVISSCEKKNARTFCGTEVTYPSTHTDEHTGEVTCSGVLEIQGMTTYQYGTHTITCGDVVHALRSQTINLNDYAGQTVTIAGNLVDEYPVDGGPDFVEVMEVIQ